jgi:hypothetical protein
MPKTHNDSPLKMSRNPMDVKSEKKTTAPPVSILSNPLAGNVVKRHASQQFGLAE